MPAPSIQAVTAYLGDSEHTPAEVGQAYAAEKAAQARTCRVPADSEAWPADLAEALMRRVARNLAMRNMPLGSQADFDNGVGMTFRPAPDSEVRRLEGPFKIRVFG